jgi:acyl dehydratase
VIAFSKEMPITFAYGFNKIRFPAPALSGARYRLRLGLIRIERILGGAQAYWNITIEAEGAAKPSLAAEWITRTYFHLRMGS